MDKKTVKAALGRRRLESQHKLDDKKDGSSPDHTDLGNSGGQPTQSSGGSITGRDTRPTEESQLNDELNAATTKLANIPYSAVKQPKQEATPWNQGGTKDEVPNGMHQIVNGESGDKLRASPKDQQGPNKALMSKILNEQGISPFRKAMASKSKSNEDSNGND